MKSNKQADMSFLDHLEELRWHIIRSFVAIIIFAILAFLFKGFVFDVVLLGPSQPDFLTNRLFCRLAEIIATPALCINQETLRFQNINMSGQFTMHIGISFVAGIVIAFPYIFYELWRFIKPALYENEVRHSRGAVFAAGSLFTLGILFAYYLIAPLSVYFLGGYSVSDSVENIINFRSYVSTVSSIVLATGVMFELPILMYFLTKVGLVTTKFLRKYRRHSIVVSVTLAAIITPPDIISQIMVAIPLIFLYEAGIIIGYRVEKKRAQFDLVNDTNNE
mgnify:CR=1 FL=1|jgi:sec-independent protein translocase protein TatC